MQLPDEKLQRWSLSSWLQRLFVLLRKDDTDDLDNEIRRDIGLPCRDKPLDTAALLDRAKFDGRRW